jgi:hypothetical protein
MEEQFLVTFFDDVYAKSLVSKSTTLAELHKLINETTALSKVELSLFKLAEFGSHRTEQGCLRNDANVVLVTGLVVDYDGEEMAMQEAVDRLDAYSLHFETYTSPRHTPSKPRFRGVLPTSKPLPPAEHNRLMNGVNGLLGGTLGAENWSLSQSYYYGHVVGVPFESYLSDGEVCVDEIDLDAIAQPFRAQSKGPGTKPGSPDFGNMDQTELLEVIKSGEHYWRPAKCLLTLWARQGVSEADAESNLGAAFDAVPQPKRDKKWAKGKKAIPRWVEDIYARVTKRRGKYFSALVDFFENTPPGAIRRNAFTQGEEVSDPFPPASGQIIDRWRQFSDPGDTLEALIRAQGAGFSKVGKGAVFDAIFLAALRHPHHPVRDWLNQLNWDGRERTDRLFLDYFPGTVPDRQADPGGHDKMLAYLEQAGTCFMIGAVARIYRPGVKLDTLPVLIAPQSFNKSKALQALVPDPSWFSDDVPVNISDKDCKQALTGKWIVELSEFPQLRRDVDHVKAFFSRQVDRYRPPYGRTPIDVPRQCAFIASVNDLEFADITGNRRFWPVLLAAAIAIEALVRDRDQLWGEAVHRYREGLAWWFPPQLEAIAREVQDSHIEADEWDTAILAFLASRTTNGTCAPFTVRQVLEHIGFNFTPGLPGCANRADEMRAARRLRRLGYRRDPHRSHGGARQWIPIQA